MADLYLTPAERYTAALGGFYYGDLPEPGTVYTQLIKDILDGSTPDKEPKNILARFIYSLYISDLGDPYPRYELAKLLYWKLHNITPTKSGSILTVTIDGKEDYMTINTDLSRLWYKVLFGSKTDVITEFPYIFNTMQNKLSDWELFGNVEVSGTPTSDSPIMPQGTGERTGNLAPYLTEWVDGYVSGNSGAIAPPSDVYKEKASDYIEILPNTQYTFSYDSTNGNFPGASDAWRGVAWYTASKQFISRPAQTNDTPLSLLSPKNAQYCRLSFRTHGNTNNTMLNTSSTALPYEPYGYKIPISSAGQTTPVYLGEVETTRKIKKLVLTGEENWTVQAALGGNRFVLLIQNAIVSDTSQINSMCSHFPLLEPGGTYIKALGYTIVNSSIYLRYDPIETVADFKSYLAAQYAAGKPVTVWYVLANPTTAVVNEPLMKIGEYADSMSRSQTGIDIPTVIGQNTLDVLTTVKPSSMSIEYTSSDENRSRSKRISLLKSPLKKRLIK